MKNILFLITFLLIFFPENVMGATHDFTGLPLTADGWTDLEALVQTDSRIVYVSNSGDDGSGEYYTPVDIEIGDNPFKPSGEVLSYATYAAAFAQLRDGYPDILLFKRGDIWPVHPNFTRIDKGGRSKTERLIVGAYGEGDRPILQDTKVAFVLKKSFIILTDLELVAVGRGPLLDGYNGVEWEGSSVDTLLEGNYIHYFRSAAVCQSNEALGSPVISDVALRRNVVADSWGSNGAHGQGIYTHQISNLLLEENVWDHNGWEETYKLQNIFDRSMYISRTTGVKVRGNIDARGSSGGAQLRDGGEYSYNLSLQNPIAIAMGHSQTLHDFIGVVKYNVILDARDINGSGRGTGIAVGNRSIGTNVFENIIAHQKSGTNSIYALAVSNEIDMNYQEGPEPWDNVYCRNTVFDNNIVYKWNKNGSWMNDNWLVRIGQSTDGLIFTNNDLQDPDGFNSMIYFDGTISNGPIVDGWIMSGNRYFSGANALPFEKRISEISTDLTFAQWIASTTEIGSTDVAVSYTDPERTIESYANLIGLNPLNYEDGLNKFLTEARKMSRWNYDTDYTALAVVNYIREGFDKNSVSYDYGANVVVIRGDVNQDNKNNTTDAMLTLRNSLGLDMANTSWQNSVSTGDVDCNNNSNSIDSMLLLRYSLGLDMSGTEWCE